MIKDAGENFADTVINMRYDANEVMEGRKEVLAYRTAVYAEKIH